MTTDASDVLSPTMAGLFVAGLSLGAVYAFNYTRLGQLLSGGAGVPGSEETRAQAHANTHVHAHSHTRAAPQSGNGSGEGEKSAEDARGGSAMGKGRRRRRGKGKGKGLSAGEGEGQGETMDEGSVGQVEGRGRGETKGGGDKASSIPLPQVVPGDFGNASADVSSPAGMTAEQSTNAKTQRKKKAKKQKQQQGKGKSKDADEDREAGSETGKEADVVRAAVHGPRSGDSTDASASLSPSVSGDAPLGSSRGMGKGKHLALPSQSHPLSRGIRPSLSFDTDSSWTHVNRRLRMSKSLEDQARGLADTIDMTSSDLASTASDSPVAERMDNVTMDMREARAGLAQRTLAEKLIPRPKTTDVDDMLEKSDVPTLARVMRVQPRADETPVPGFSWEDYGDVVEDSVLVHDADEEDDGEWGMVKSRNRTRPLQTTTTAAAASTSTSHAPAPPETMTKKQRQNARKRELAKVAKAEAEETRLQGLAKHKRELERLRIIEQSRQGGGKQPSGGMQAAVDDRGKLVWE